MQSKPLVALTAGAVLFLGALCQSAEAQGILESNMAVLPAVNGVAADALDVSFIVSESGGVFTYTYDVINPSSDPAYVGSFEIGFNAGAPGAVTAGSLTGGSGRQNNGNTGITWFLSVAPGHDSGPLSFNSGDTWHISSANATGLPNPPAPWTTLPFPGGVAVPNPPVVPEPATTALLAFTVLGAAGRRIFGKA